MASDHGSRENMRDINFVPRLYAFVRRWDKRRERHSAPISLPCSSAGNINFFGTSDLWIAPVVTRWHPSFADCLENNVKDLVFLLVERLDCITYSSCQGHPRFDTSDDPPLRYVSILPRHEDEYESLMHSLGEVAHYTNTRLPLGLCVAVEIRKRRVLTSDGPAVEGIDFVFAPAGSPMDDAYLRDVEVAYSLSCEAFRLLPLAKKSPSGP